MERRKALAVAAGVSAAVFAAAVAIGVNVGILNSAAEDNPVGSIDADELVDTTSSATAPSTPSTIVIDEIVTVPGSADTTPGAATPTTVPPTVQPASPLTSATSVDDHGGDDHDNSGKGSDDDDHSGSGRDGDIEGEDDDD